MNGNTIRYAMAVKFHLIILVLVMLSGLLFQVHSEAAQQGLLAEGDRAPEFTLPNVLGGTVSLADYMGKQPVLLFFHMAVG